MLLQKYTKSEGPFARKAEVKQDGVNGIKIKFLVELINAINNRFKGDLQLFQTSSFINFKNWPGRDDDDESIADFGDDDIQTLVEVCGECLSADCESNSIEPEWTRFKADLYRTRKHPHQLTSWEGIWESMQPKFPNLFKMVSLLLTLPSSSVDAELGFSRMKILKTDWRSCLKDTNLSDQLLIAAEGESVGEFDPDMAIHHWESMATRVRRPFVNDKEKPKVIFYNKNDLVIY